MDAPTHYEDISTKALEAKEKYNLTDTQTLLYNHICRGDFKLRNEDGQNFYDKDNNGFGWRGSREWVKKQFQPLIKAGLVKFESIHDCRDGKYTSWYFYCPQFDLNDLIDAFCYVSTGKIAMIKHYLNLPDGFNKKNQTYGDIEFIHNKKGYSFKYKGEENIYGWDSNGEGNKRDLTWLTGKQTYNYAIYKEQFQELIHDIWSFLAHNGYKYISEIPQYTNKRRCIL